MSFQTHIGICQLFHFDRLTGPDVHIFIFGDDFHLVSPVLVVHMEFRSLEEFHNVIKDFHSLVIEVSDTLDEDGDGDDSDNRKDKVDENLFHCIVFLVVLFFYYKDNTFFLIFQIFLR